MLRSPLQSISVRTGAAQRGETRLTPDLQSLPFDPTDPEAALLQLPHASASSPSMEPTSTQNLHRPHPNLRARLERLLQPSPKHPRRLHLAGRVRRIEYRLTGSDFESLLLQFELIENVYGPKSFSACTSAHQPSSATSAPTPIHASLLRIALVSAKPTGPMTIRLPRRRRALRDEALKLFLLRRCTFELEPDLSYPAASTPK